jgi:hypothetical protein
MPDGSKVSWDWHLLPDSSHSKSWDDGYKSGYMHLYPIEHTKDFLAGYNSGVNQVKVDKEFCKDILMKDHQSCAHISHYSGPLNMVASSGPVKCHKGVCEAIIGKTNSNESKSNTTG